MTDAGTATGYWIVVGSPGNFEKTAEHGFTVQGLKSRHRKKAERMKPGDKIIYYITGQKAFAGVVTIESPYFESHETIWVSSDPKKAAEDYPFRVEITPDVILGLKDATPAEPLARQMQYAAKWPEKNWTLAFQGNVHKLSDADHALLAAAVQEAAR